MVVVSADEVLVEGRKVAAVADVLAAEGDLIAPLKAELDVQAQRQVIRKENEAKGKTVTIMGDKDIPYRLLRKIMVSCSQAGFSDVSFSTMRFGLPRSFVKEIGAEFPLSPFYPAHVYKVSFKWLLRHPLNPVPILRW